MRMVKYKGSPFSERKYQPINEDKAFYCQLNQQISEAASSQIAELVFSEVDFCFRQTQWEGTVLKRIFVLCLFYLL